MSLIISNMTKFIVQRNVAGSRPAMEMVGFQNCMDSLIACNLNIDTIVTDRHTSITKHMRERLSHIKHNFDLWHLQKSKDIMRNVFNAMILSTYNHVIQFLMKYTIGCL